MKTLTHADTIRQIRDQMNILERSLSLIEHIDNSSLEANVSVIYHHITMQLYTMQDLCNASTRHVKTAYEQQDTMDVPSIQSTKVDEDAFPF